MGILSKDRRWLRNLGGAGPIAAAVMATVLSGCYSPELQDCVVACAVAADCGPGQTCGGDGWCAGGDAVGQCDPPSEEPPAGTGDELRVVIEGQGEVEIDTSGFTSLPNNKICISRRPTGATCAYPMAAGMWATLRQKEVGGWRFNGWSWIACTLGKPKSCLVRTGMGSTLVSAKFVEP